MSTINLGLEASRAAGTFSLPETLERAAGFLLLAAAAPVIATSAMAVSVLSGRPPFIAHLRVARDGKPFWMLKLRSMWPVDGEKAGSGAWIERIVADPEDQGHGGYKTYPPRGPDFSATWHESPLGMISIGRRLNARCYLY